MPYFLATLKICKEVMLFKHTYDFLIIRFGRWSIYLYMSDKMLLPRHTDKSKLRTKRRKKDLMWNTSRYWNSFFFWDSSTITQSTQGKRWKYLLTVSRHVIFLDFYKVLFFFSFFLKKKIIVEICVEMIQNLGGWNRDNRNV